MNKELMLNPSIAGWQLEIEMLVTGMRELDLRKLGSPSLYIKNTFTYSADKEYSIDCFRESFNIFISEQNSKNNVSKEVLYLIIDVINYFKSSTEYNTSSLNYLNFATSIVLKFIKNGNALENENSIYLFCKYLNFSLKIDFENYSSNSLIQKSISEILKEVLYLSERITALALFILYSLNESELLGSETLNNKVASTILSLAIRAKSRSVPTLNKFITRYAVNNPESFTAVLSNNKSRIGADYNAIVYEDGESRYFLEEEDYPIFLERLAATYSNRLKQSEEAIEYAFNEEYL